MRRGDTEDSDDRQARTGEAARARRRRASFNAALLSSIFLFGLGAWFALSGSATFQFGGDPESVHAQNHVIHVDAHGYDAVAIGLVFVGLAFVNLALGIAGPARIPVFWVGAGIFGAAVLYGLVNALLAVKDAFG